jgi:exonuclease III
MPFYRDLRDRDRYTADEADWIARRLLDLRARLRQPPPVGVARRVLDSSLVIGTWNLRDFDNNKFRHGPRRQEALHYIAEVISSFDVCALQEVSEDLSALERVMKLLGPSWTFIATDVTEGASGNRERMCFVFDTRKVRFRNIAGEVVLPRHKLLPNEEQFARTPFLVSFECGWFRFSLCTVHIYFGEDSKNSDGYQRRVAEIRHIAELFAKKADREGENYILLGDFNIKNPIDETMSALKDAGFILPPELFPSNLLGNKYYDQIAFRTKRDELTFVSAGVFDYSKAVFRTEDYAHYAHAMPARHRELTEAGQPRSVDKDRDYYAGRWRTWQMSDHLPLWVELAVDFSDAYLGRFVDPAAARRAAGAQIEQVEAPEDTGPTEDGRTPEVEVSGRRASGRVKVADPAPPPTRRRAAPRKAPPKPPQEKVGVAQPDQPFTLGEAWQILKFVASGKADELNKLRRERERAAKAARRKQPK